MKNEQKRPREGGALLVMTPVRSCSTPHFKDSNEIASKKCLVGLIVWGIKIKMHILRTALV